MPRRHSYPYQLATLDSLNFLNFKKVYRRRYRPESMQIQVPLSVPILGEAPGQANVLISDPTPQRNILPPSFSQAWVELCATG